MDLIDGIYRVERTLGEGGMGVVFEVTDLRTGRRCALKRLRPELTRDRELGARFVRETEMAGRISSPNVVRVLAAGGSDDTGRYMVMELLEGCDLAYLLETRGALPLEEAVPLLADACAGLAAAHAVGVVHRDLKPENLFVVDGACGRTVKVLDFGVARALDAKTRLTAKGDVFGSPTYMAPEQVAGRDADATADVWALGVIFYRALTGRGPFDGSSVPHTFVRIVRGDYVPLREVAPQLPIAVDRLVARCLEIDPSKRFRTAGELGVALRALMPPLPSSAPRIALSEARAVALTCAR